MLRAFYDRDAALEVREYDPFVVAEVTIDSQEMKDALSTGFRAVSPQHCAYRGWEFTFDTLTHIQIGGTLMQKTNFPHVYRLRASYLAIIRPAQARVSR